MSGTAERQAAVWNGAAGRGWVDAQAVLDRLFAPVAELLVAEVRAVGARRVLDVGCGAGGTTVAIARELAGNGGTCTGVDVSEPMIEAARLRDDRSVGPRFVVADAQRHSFEPATYDAVVSRFGVMFFDDPVAAFANLRAGARDGGALRCVVWRSADENPFMTTAETAAAPLLAIPPRDPHAPGQFAFADPGRVRPILEASGWSAIEIEPVDVACTLPEPALHGYLTRLGPVGRALVDADEATRARVAAAIRPAFDPYVDNDEVRFTSALWMLRATA